MQKRVYLQILKNSLKQVIQFCYAYQTNSETLRFISQLKSCFFNQCIYVYANISDSNCEMHHRRTVYKIIQNCTINKL